MLSDTRNQAANKIHVHTSINNMENIFQLEAYIYKHCKRQIHQHPKKINQYLSGTHQITNKSAANDSQCQVIKLWWTDAYQKPTWLCKQYNSKSPYCQISYFKHTYTSCIICGGSLTSTDVDDRFFFLPWTYNKCGWQTAVLMGCDG